MGIDLNSVDERGSTPLHWASYSSSETALAYLLSYCDNVNIQDSEGYTPLHLAVKNVENLEMTRVVRALLIKGAKTDIKNNEGKNPIDLIKDIEN